MDIKRVQTVKSKFPNMYEALTNVPGCALWKMEYVEPFYMYHILYSDREAFNRLIAKVHAINAQYYYLDDCLKLEYTPELKLIEDKKKDEQ